MSLQFSVAVRNGRLDSIETTIGSMPILRIRTGTQPATCATADSGSVLATVTLASNWLANASGGTKLKGAEDWTDSSADASGTAGHYRLYDSAGTTCHMQGPCRATADAEIDGGEMVIDSTNFAAGQVFTITSWVLVEGNG